MRIKKIMLILILAVIFTSCVFKEKVVQQKKALIIGDPLECGIPQILLFPVGTATYTIKNKKSHNRVMDIQGDINMNSSSKLYFSENKMQRYDRLATTEFVNEREQDFDISNILFYNLLTGESKPLTKDSLHILSFATHNEFLKPLIFYRVVKTDNNGDKKFTKDDPVMLYASLLNGDSLTQITSEQEQFVDYFYYPKVQKILIKTIADSDNNKKFESHDETNFLEMNLLTLQKGREIFSKNLKDTLKIQF